MLQVYSANTCVALALTTAIERPLHQVIYIHLVQQAPKLSPSTSSTTLYLQQILTSVESQLIVVIGIVGVSIDLL